MRCIIQVMLVALSLLYPLGKLFAQSTGGQAEARHHYQVAQLALQNGDMAVASSELEKAARLDPNNPLVEYNLAVVDSKSGRPESGLAHLNRAQQLGLPPEQRASAEQLAAELDYGVQKSAAGLGWLSGTWQSEADSEDRVDLLAANARLFTGGRPYDEGWYFGVPLGYEIYCLFKDRIFTTLTMEQPAGGKVIGRRRYRHIYEGEANGAHAPTVGKYQWDTRLGEECARVASRLNADYTVEQSVEVIPSEDALTLSETDLRCSGQGCPEMKGIPWKVQMTRQGELQLMTFDPNDNSVPKRTYRKSP